MGAGVGIAIVVIVAVVAIALLIGVVLFVRSSNRRIRTFEQSTDLIPGRQGRAPAQWATSAAPEARLHQRVRYAIAAVHGREDAGAPPPHDSAAVGDQADLVALDDAVFDLDDRIIAASQLDGDERAAALSELESAVQNLEGLHGRLWEAKAARRRELIDATAARIRR